MATISDVVFVAAGGSVTVPADAEAVLIGWCFYSPNPGGNVTALSFGGASSLTEHEEIARGSSPDALCLGLASGLITATGSQTLSITYSETPSEGPIFTLVFIKDINTSDWFRAYDIDTQAGSTAPTATVASVATDLVVAICQRFSAQPNTETGYTSVETVDNVGGEYGKVQTANSPGASTTSYTSTNPNYSTVALVSIKADTSSGYTLTAESGTYTLTGQSADLRFQRTALAAVQGSYSLTGQAATLVKSGSYSLVAEFGSYLLTGSGALVDLSMNAAQGSYALSGQVATLTYTPLAARTLTADFGSYALTGQAASQFYARILAAVQGSYSMGGYPANLSYSGAPAPTGRGIMWIRRRR